MKSGAASAAVVELAEAIRATAVLYTGPNEMTPIDRRTVPGDVRCIGTQSDRYRRDRVRERDAGRMASCGELAERLVGSSRERVMIRL